MGLIASHSSRRAFARLCVSGATGVIAGRALGSGSASAAATSARLPLSDAEWRKRLPPPAYAVLRKGATEQPFTSPLLKEHRNGRFVCAGCAQHLFSSTTKFDSGTGWPSFYAAFPRSVATVADGSFGMQRTGQLRALRWSPVPCVQGRPAANGPALLHEWRGSEVSPGLRPSCMDVLAAGPIESGLADRQACRPSRIAPLVGARRAASSPAPATDQGAAGAGGGTVAFG